jgi:SAM-dependent methyltransferase
MNHDEPGAVAQRYARRATADRYSPLQPDVMLLLQERQRALRRRLAAQGITDLAPLRVVEVGCGSGGNLLELLRLGCRPERLQGIELLPERYAQARQVLPARLGLWLGDAVTAPVADASQDIVMQCTVFSSLLDAAFQQRLADTMWRWLRPGGAVLWYDFTMDNPRNRDVRGVPMARLQTLFPQGRIQSQRITLAPPLARALCRVHPSLCTVFNLMPWLRTHVLAWVEKPENRAA